MKERKFSISFLEEKQSITWALLPKYKLRIWSYLCGKYLNPYLGNCWWKIRRQTIEQWKYFELKREEGASAMILERLRLVVIVAGSKEVWESNTLLYLRVFVANTILQSFTHSNKTFKLIIASILTTALYTNATSTKLHIIS